MLVHKSALVLKDALSKNELKPELGHLKVTNKKVTACNGYVVFEIENADQTFLEDFPKNDIENTEEPVYLNPTTIKKIESNLPKKTNLPILEHFKIGKKDGEYQIAVTDLDNMVTITQREPDIEYPEIEQFYIKEDEVHHEVYLSVEVLDMLVKVVKNLKKSATSSDSYPVISFKFPKNMASPITIKCLGIEPNMKGIIMPARMPETL